MLSADFLTPLLKQIFQEFRQLQTVRIQSRPDILSDLIWALSNYLKKCQQVTKNRHKQRNGQFQTRLVVRISKPYIISLCSNSNLPEAKAKD